MKKLIFLFLLFPVLAQANFKERTFACHWEIAQRPSLDAFLFNSAMIKLTQTKLTFGYLNDYGEEEELSLDTYTPVMAGRLFTAQGPVPIKIGDEPAQVVSILLKPAFYKPYDRNNFAVKFEIVTKRDGELVYGRGSCILANQI